VLHAAAHSLTYPSNAAESHANVPPTPTTASTVCTASTVSAGRAVTRRRRRLRRLERVSPTHRAARAGAAVPPATPSQREGAVLFLVGVVSEQAARPNAARDTRRQWLRCRMRCAWRARIPRADAPGARPVRVAMWCGCNAGCPHCTTRRGAARATRCRRVVPYSLCLWGYCIWRYCRASAGALWRRCRGAAVRLCGRLCGCTSDRTLWGVLSCPLSAVDRTSCGGSTGREDSGPVSRPACCSREVGFSASNRGMIVIRLLHSRRYNPLAYNSCRLL
jgi:hypothetical protein